MAEREDWEFGGRSERPKARRRGKNPQDVQNPPDEDSAIETSGRRGGRSTGVKIVSPESWPEVEGGDQRGGGSDDPEGEGQQNGKGCPCPGCSWPPIDVQAYQVLGAIGRKFSKAVLEDRVMAFEGLCKDLGDNMSLLAFSRIMGVDSQIKMILQTHTMIGAPTKKAETSEEKPLEMFSDWLNGEDVPEFDRSPLEPSPSDPSEDGVESEADDG